MHVGCGGPQSVDSRVYLPSIFTLGRRSYFDPGNDCNAAFCTHVRIEPLDTITLRPGWALGLTHLVSIRRHRAEKRHDGPRNGVPGHGSSVCHDGQEPLGFKVDDSRMRTKKRRRGEPAASQVRFMSPRRGTLRRGRGKESVCAHYTEFVVVQATTNPCSGGGGVAWGRTGCAL